MRFLRSIRLQLISTHRSVERIRHVASNAIYETDYYVIVADSYAGVRVLLDRASHEMTT